MKINKTSIMGKLMNTLPQVGEVTWIGIRPKKRGNVQAVNQVTVTAKKGLEGDHYSSEGGKRQVTFIQAEHLVTVAAILQKEVTPEDLRRNIVVKGINLLALKDQQFQIDDCIFETTGNCHPCSRMETNLGAGGYNAMRGHGGITAKVLQGGTIKIGSSVKFLNENS